MSQELLKPLPQLLELIAVAIHNGASGGGLNAGPGIFNWPEIVESQRSSATTHLRQELERRTNGHRTVRVAAAKLVPRKVEGLLLFAVVVCDARRIEGPAGLLLPGDELYIVTAAEQLSHGVYLRRLKR